MVGTCRLNFLAHCRAIYMVYRWVEMVEPRVKVNVGAEAELKMLERLVSCVNIWVCNS